MDRLLLAFKFFSILVFAGIFSCAEDDLYRVLGVDKLATTQEIKHAYKSLAREWHPDKNPDPTANEKFLKINEAYETLSNDEKRSQYDNFGTTSAHVGQDQRWSDNEFSGTSFSFGGFTFTFNGRTSDNLGQKYSLTLRSYEDVVIPGSRKRPYIIFVYSDYCDECTQIEENWKMFMQDLVKAEIGIGTVNYESDKSLVKRLRVSRVPSVVGVIDGQLHWFTGSSELKSLRDFARRLFPSDLIQQVNNVTKDIFLSAWQNDNKVRLLFFDIRKLPPLRIIAAAFGSRSYVAVGYVNMAQLECDFLIESYQLNRSQENLLMFKEDISNPVIKITMSEIKRSDINEAIERNQFLTLPRISSPTMFYNYCLALSPLNMRRFCIILLSKRIPEHDIYRESFREYASRQAQERVRFGYVYEETQAPLVRLMTWGSGAVNDPLGTLKVAIMWLKEPKTVHYDLLENGWYASGSDLQRSRRKLKQITDWLLQTGDVMPYMMKLHSEIIDEHARNIWIRIMLRLQNWIDRLWDKILNIDEILLLTVVTTAILVVVTGMLVRVLVMTEDAKVQSKIAPKENKKKSFVQNGNSNSQSVEDTRPTVHIYPLCHDNYDELVLQGGNEVQLVIILVDEASRAKLLQYFAWILLPHLKSQPYKVAFLQLEDYLPWYRSLLEVTIGLLDNSDEFKYNLLHINMRNCLGTVIAINSQKKFYYMYHYSITKSSSSERVDDDDLSSNESVQELKSKAEKLFESDLVRGLGQWMERLSRGKLKKYHVAFWPDMKK